MEKQNVLVGIANKKEVSMQINDIKDWEPKKVAYIGQTTYFQHEETFYSMKTTEFKELYGHKIKK